MAGLFIFIFLIYCLDKQVHHLKDKEENELKYIECLLLYQELCHFISLYICYLI